MGKLIDADELYAAFRRDIMGGLNYDRILREAKPVDAVQVVTGTWKAVTDDGENYKRICTCCGKEAPFDELEGVYLIYPHCPWCGADMRKDVNRHE